MLLLCGRVAATATTRSGRVVRFGGWAGPCALDKVAVNQHGDTARGGPAGGVAAERGRNRRRHAARTQQVLADLLGVTRVTVNRALFRLRRDGLIEIDRGTIAILAPELLALRAEG